MNEKDDSKTHLYLKNEFTEHSQQETYNYITSYCLLHL